MRRSRYFIHADLSAVQRTKICRSDLPAIDVIRRLKTFRTFLLLPCVPILRHCDAFVTNFTAAEFRTLYRKMLRYKTETLFAVACVENERIAISFYIISLHIQPIAVKRTVTRFRLADMGARKYLHITIRRMSLIGVNIPINFDHEFRDVQKDLLKNQSLRKKSALRTRRLTAQLAVVITNQTRCRSCARAVHGRTKREPARRTRRASFPRFVFVLANRDMSGDGSVANSVAFQAEVTWFEFDHEPIDG
ncbi:hypothetical protein EVAR_80595_1 [Eumeta japonica]|uniref:Uncharacterized protein n=1 Tax=Eumeta variegata TaxID=151549 RepID=A0A4C1TMU3_EUMVA|nr:hypothetical protein EVAR_80595_1 [Eumeta japonica]